MDEMRPHRLDERTADRLLAGAVGPEDAPPGYAGVAGLLTQAATPALPGQHLAGEAATVAAMQSVTLGHLVPVSDPEGKRNMISRLATVKAAAAAAVVVLGAGSAAAATGSLPGPVQNTTAHLLSDVGVNVPTGDTHAPDPHSNGHANPNATGTTGGTGGSGSYPNPHADWGLCNAQSHNGGSPGKSHVFPVKADCSTVTKPGDTTTTTTAGAGTQSGTTGATEPDDSATEPDDSATEGTEPPDSSSDAPPTSTPANGTEDVSRPDEGTSGSGTTPPAPTSHTHS